MNTRIPRLRALHLLLGIGSLVLSASAQQNVAINATGAAAAPNALLDISSITKGLLIPRFTALPAAAPLPQGLTVYRTTAPIGFYAVDYGQWMPLIGGNNGWNVFGNYLVDVTNPNPEYLGTTDNKTLNFRTNGVHRMSLDAGTGFLGVGYPIATAAAERMDINGALRLIPTISGTSPDASATNAPGVVRYQPYANPVVTNTTAVAPEPPYNLLFSGHWGNVDGTNTVVGSATTAPSTQGWRRFENPYTEVFGKTWKHFGLATCAPGTADIPTGVTTYQSLSRLLPNQQTVVPFRSDLVTNLGWRQQYLYLKSQLNVELAQSLGTSGATQGLCPGATINTIAFNVNATPAELRNLVANNYSITVMHAPDGFNVMNGFNNQQDAAASCAVIPGPTWPSVSGLHWETLNLVPPFVWDGIHNIIIQVAIKTQLGAAPQVANASNLPDVLLSYEPANVSHVAWSTSPAFPCSQPTPFPNNGCIGPLNPQEGYNDACGTTLPIYSKSYYDRYRPVVRFGGNVASAGPPLLGTDRYINYTGAFILEDTSTTITSRPWGLWQPNFPPGNNSWSNQGDSTISAEHGVYDDGSRLNDHVFDRAFDGRVSPKDAKEFGDQRALDIQDMAAFTRAHRHLPTMKGRAAWNAEQGFSLGDLTNQLWTTTETHALYVADLNDRLNVLEMLTDERPLAPDEYRVAKTQVAAMGDLSDAQKARLLGDLRRRANLTPPSR